MPISYIIYLKKSLAAKYEIWILYKSSTGLIALVNLLIFFKDSAYYFDFFTGKNAKTWEVMTLNEEGYISAGYCFLRWKASMCMTFFMSWVTWWSVTLLSRSHAKPFLTWNVHLVIRALFVLCEDSFKNKTHCRGMNQ